MKAAEHNDTRYVVEIEDTVRKAAERSTPYPGLNFRGTFRELVDPA